jgi:hypothetical protein
MKPKVSRGSLSPEFQSDGHGTKFGYIVWGCSVTKQFGYGGSTGILASRTGDVYTAWVSIGEHVAQFYEELE